MEKDIEYRLTELQTALRAIEYSIGDFTQKNKDDAYLLNIKAALTIVRTKKREK